MNPEIEEFAKILVAHVRDISIHTCDRQLDATATSVIARRWRAQLSSPADVRVVIPDIVDTVIGYLLIAIEQGMLPLKYVSSTGREVDLPEEGTGELSGAYEGEGGWVEAYSAERFVNDPLEMPPDR